jgi:5-methylcytosine-specific restriction endonuclease McrA
MGAWEKNKRAQQRRQALRARALEYKGGKCVICGYDKCPAAMDMHHISDLSKEFNISSRMTSWERIKKELDKCELLCSRCHREVHDGMHPSLLALNEDRGRDEDEFFMDIDPSLPER